MRARCERHDVALVPSACLMCRREQVSDAAAEAAVQSAFSGASAAPAPAAAAPEAAASAPTVAATTTAAPVSPLPDPPHAAPALVTDFPPPRQLSIQIPRSVVVLLPV